MSSTTTTIAMKQAWRRVRSRQDFTSKTFIVPSMKYSYSSTLNSNNNSKYIIQFQQQYRILHRQQQKQRFVSFSSAAEPDASDEISDSNSVSSITEQQQLYSIDVNHPTMTPAAIDGTTTRRRLSEVLISEVLKAKDSYRWVEPTISRTATVKQAIETTIDGGLSGMMVLDTNNSINHNNHDNHNSNNDDNDNHRKVVGLLTSRDLLRIMASGFKDGMSNDAILEEMIVGDFMTPISQVIYARPDETVGMCRTIMAKLGIKCLPVLSRQGKVEGLITARDMSDYGLSAKDKGGKQSYLNDISERVGLSSNTSMAEPPNYLKAHLALEQNPLYLNVGISELPHPYKTEHIAGRNQRDIGRSEYTTDPALSEDAYFCTTVQFADEKDKSLLRSYTYMGVADGVGSWREYGVDPRDFSHGLMAECENILMELSHTVHQQQYGSNIHNNSKNIVSGFSANNHLKAIDGRKVRHVISPAEIMSQAYDRVKSENVIGSSTACIALFDGVRHQLHFSNLGDSGLIVLRHIDSDVAGSLKRDRTKPRLERESDLRVAFVSQQQLRSFNHPYQLGWTGEEIREGESTSFKEAKHSCTTSVHIRRGDIVIMATDGLFDNVEVEDIASICLEWEQTNGFIRGGDICARDRRWSMGNSLAHLSMERIGDLADALCQKARMNSINSDIDSPFAILAKENDVMWSGGMPDDCTVLAVHVTGRDGNDVMNTTHL